MYLKPDIEAVFYFVGDRKDIVYEGYRPAHLLSEGCLTTGVHNYYDLENRFGDTIKGTITFISPEHYPACLSVDQQIEMYEGKILVGYATITKIFNPILEKGE